MCANLVIVWCLTGFWHGAAWNFLAWGGYFALILIVEKLWLKEMLAKFPAVFGHVYALLAIVVGWVFFDAADLGEIGQTLLALFGGSGVAASGAAWYYLRSNAIVLGLAIAAATPLPARVMKRCGERFPRLAVIVEPVILLGLLFLATAFLVSNSFNPFIYFRF
jgi:alginate O-acetyltransferase complex protein AlgI